MINFFIHSPFLTCVPSAVTHAHMQRPGSTLGVFCHSPSYILRQGLSLSLHITDEQASGFHLSPCPLPAVHQSWGYRHVSPYPSFYMGAGESVNLLNHFLSPLPLKVICHIINLYSFLFLLCC